MARTVRNAKTDSRTARARLAQRAEPYWTVISEGCALGYRRGVKGGTWIARFRDDNGKQHYEALGSADDACDPDDIRIFSFAQAQVRARAYFQLTARQIAGDIAPYVGPFTIAAALEDYQAGYLRRGGKAVGRIESAKRNYILPALGDLPVAKLTRRKLEEWHQATAKSPAHVRTRSGAAPKCRRRAETPEGLRQRSASANRVLTVLKAALNAAYQEGRVATNDAWQRVKPFRNVDKARIRYLSDDEARRLVTACSEDFGALVIAALMTGCRYGELAALMPDDFDDQSGTVTIRVSKSNKSRHVVLSAEGRLFFRGTCEGRAANALLFTKRNGRAWSTSDQQRPLAAACAAATIAPITFHGLRHTYASRLAMKGVPLTVIAAQLGHADVRMVERHYGHLSPNYIADTVRAAFGSMGLTQATDGAREGQRSDRPTLSAREGPAMHRENVSANEHF
jgi:integrase